MSDLRPDGIGGRHRVGRPLVDSTVRAVIVADGDVEPAALAHAAEPDLVVFDHGGARVARAFVICADGGALKAEAAGLRPDLVLGDGDSLPAADRTRLGALGVDVRIVPAEKDESDTELCLREAVRLGADPIVIHGALGGRRPEHSVANLALLALPELDGRSVTIEHATSRVRLVGRRDGSGEIRLTGRVGDLVSLLPLGEGAEGVTTRGLRYALHGEPLRHGPARGLSNEIVDPDIAGVTVGRGRLLVIETARTESPPGLALPVAVAGEATS